MPDDSTEAARYCVPFTDTVGSRSLSFEHEGVFDVCDVIELCRAHDEQMGIDADSIDSLFR